GTPGSVPRASTTPRDGLGPLYNAHACASCHRPAARVRADEGGEPPTRMVLRIGRRVGGAFVPDPVYGDTIQRRGIPGLAAGATGEARWGIAHVAGGFLVFATVALGEMFWANEHVGVGVIIGPGVWRE